MNRIMKAHNGVTILVPKILLICGILSSLLYVGADILASIRWEAYSYVSQSVSELMAIGAPTRPFLILPFTLCNVLSIAFGAGLWLADTRKRAGFIGLLFAVYGIVGQAGLLFFPMHLREAEKTVSDTMHIISAGVLVCVILLSMGIGTTLYGKRFRLYSIVSILILLLFGVWAGMDGPRVAAQLPTPWLGIKERINIYGYLLWVIVLAAKALQTRKAQTQTAGAPNRAINY